MTAYSVTELRPESWLDFERVVEKHHGIWGGCWCITFHLASRGSDRTVEQNHSEKEELVRANRSPAALVYDGADIAGWCQFGPPAELPARMSGYRNLSLGLPDWRVTCFFVDRDHRRRGVAKAALAGALRMIATRGGGTVDGDPNDSHGRSTSGSLLWSGTASMFAEAGYRPIGALGPSKSVMRKEVLRTVLTPGERSM
jgi:GNAT superfamily N-acetyltransferase